MHTSYVFPRSVSVFQLTTTMRYIPTEILTNNQSQNYLKERRAFKGFELHLRPTNPQKIMANVQYYRNGTGGGVRGSEFHGVHPGCVSKNQKSPRG